MTKQEQIKNGLIQLTKSRPMTYQILKFLVDMGVVVKSDDQSLPNLNWALCELPRSVAKTAQEDMLRSNFCRVESLSNEKENTI